ncbi:MAG: Gfo/Idh/MocA family oxidoreductase, partial [Gemmatimonadetes bacterium]|nr:Gfo/Idh/MocA family oxidoreductase [Gemmatimonadota bacterium]
AKKHMLIEKPMSLTGPEAEEMVQAARDNGVVLTMHHNRHYDRDYCLVKHAVLDGAVGEIVSLENRTMGARPAVGFGVPDYNQQWRVTAAAGGGTLLDFGPHWVEQIIDLMSGHKVVSVFADVRHTKWGDSDDLFDIVMVFDNGVRARAAKADISFYSLPYKWVVLGTEATLVCERGGGGEVTVYGEDSEEVRTDAVPRENLHANIARHLREGEELIITAEHGLRVMQVLHAARESGASGKSVDVEI